MKTLFEALNEQIKLGRDSVAAVLVQDSYSGKVRYGTHMLMDERGIISGHFYKSYVEHGVKKCAERVFEGYRGGVREFAYSSSEKGREERARFCLCYIEANKEKNRQMARRALELLKEGESMWLAVNLQTAELSVIDAFGVSCGGRVPAKVCKKHPSYAVVVKAEGEYYLEPIHYDGKIYIVGAGDISLSLVDILKKTNFRVVIIDDNIECANRERFPDVYDIQIMDYYDLNHFMIEPEDSIVIATRNFQFDEVAAAQMLRTPAHSIVTVSNGQKWLKDQGFCPEDIGRITDISMEEYKSKSPYEIALGIAVALIKGRID